MNLSNLEGYKAFSLEEVEKKLKKYSSDLNRITINDVKQKVAEINKYENFSSLRNPNPKDILIIEQKGITQAEKTVLSGRFFWEHAAAGEATRLGLGTKYQLMLNEFSVEKLRQMITCEYVEDSVSKGIKLEEAEKQAKEKFSEENILQEMTCNPQELEQLSLGTRHMLQMSFDVAKLAKKHNIGVSEVLAKQKMLVILNEQTSNRIAEEFESWNFFGIPKKNILFMVQKSFHGMQLEEGRLFYDEDSPLRLHNHGQMAMQKCSENSLFLQGEYISFNEYLTTLSQMTDMLSYNIEDLEYLTSAIDLESLGCALELGKNGYEMVMEVVSQNQYRPQKGGACMHDSKLDKVIMLETNRLGSIKYDEIRYLNKNFNHYPNPSKSMAALREKGLNMQFDVKEHEGKEHIYPCPVQGDINFLVKTAFVMRRELKPIHNLKSPATMPAAVAAMKKQDMQEGFLEFADKIKEGI
ncbi:MAG: hypothetical protein ABIF10_05195 [Candidatus Woesearchaeota archaeon]